MACLAEDVFDQLSDELDVERRDLTKRLEHHHKEGYVDGALTTENNCIQKFFDRGYSQGFQCCYKIAALRGKLSALLHLRQRTDSAVDRDQQLNQQCSDSISALKRLEQQLCTDLSLIREVPPLALDSLSQSDSLSTSVDSSPKLNSSIASDPSSASSVNLNSSDSCPLPDTYLAVVQTADELLHSLTATQV